MEDKVGFVPWASAYSALTPDTKAHKQLKILTLYYDKLIFPVTKAHLAGIALVAANQTGVQKADILTAWYSLGDVASELVQDNMVSDLFNPSQESGGIWNKKGNFKKGFVGPIDQSISLSLSLSANEVKRLRKENDYNYVKEANAVGITSLNSAFLWVKLQGYVHCSIASFLPIEVFVAKQLLQANNVINATSMLRSIEIFVPEIGDLLWEEIFELRKDKRIHGFRRWLSNQITSIDAENSFSSAIEELWNAIESIRPKTAGTILEAIGGNLPLPIPINPIGIFSSLKTIKNSVEFNTTYEWLIFLHSIRKKRK